FDFPHGQSPGRHPDLLHDGVSMPGYCPAPFLSCGSPLWKTFRSKANVIPVDEQNCSPSHRNRCSPSDRNAVRNQNGMVFVFRPESRSPSTGFTIGVLHLTGQILEGENPKTLVDADERGSKTILAT